jgi:hypothetical protein
VIVGAGEHRTGVDLAEVAGTPTATVSGSINIVNRDRCTGTSIVLVPETTFDETLVRGEVAPGLRAPPPGTPPDIDGPWSIAGVPDGRYVVLAAFENDGCVRDPDPGIAGTEIEHIAVPDPAEGREITLDEQFKVTGALRIIGPGATEPEAVTGAPTLAWSRDSSADEYHLVVYDAFGTEVWAPDPIPAEGSADPAVPYAGPDLEPGMYHQFRATSIRREGPISMTEDLLGVFFRPAE